MDVDCNMVSFDKYSHTLFPPSFSPKKMLLFKLLSWDVWDTPQIEWLLIREFAVPWANVDPLPFIHFYVRVSLNGGPTIAGWLISWKIHLQMDDN